MNLADPVYNFLHCFHTLQDVLYQHDHDHSIYKYINYYKYKIGSRAMYSVYAKAVISNYEMSTLTFGK